MIQGLLFILKLIGWIILGILGIILGILLFVLISAIRYRIDGKKEGKLEGEVRITWLFRILTVTIAWRNGLHVNVKVFGKTIGKKKESAKSNRKDTLESGKDTEYPKAEAKERNELEEKQKELEELLNKKEKAESEWMQAEYAQDEQINQKAEKPTLREKFAALLQKLRFSFEKICGKLRQIQEKWNCIQDKWNWFLEKWTFAVEYIQKPENQASARRIFRQIKKIFRHIFPRKGTSTITFGREDPYVMGKFVSYASAVYPFTHKFLTFHPVFGEDVMEGEVHLRGRIRLGVILGYLLRLLFDKNIRRQLFGLLRKKKNR